MKNILLLFLLPLAAFAQKPQFVVKCSMPYAVYTYVERLTEGYRENAFREQFRKSPYYTEKYKKLIADFENVDLSQSYNYSEYPQGQKIPYMVITMVRHNLVESSTPEEFRMRSLGLMPQEKLSVFAEVLKEFLPVYEKLVYEPNKAAFEAQLKELSRYVAEKDISGYFDTGLQFYNSTWDTATPFIINIFPTLGSKAFRATALVNNAISELPSTFTDYDGLFGVILHEIYHILYDEQPLQVKQEIRKWFDENPSPSSQYAYLLLNEALATAMGNGFVYEQLTGDTDKQEWYNLVYINKMAQAIYPVVKQYALHKKPIDKAFADAYIAAYDTFKGWRSEAQHVFTYRAVVADDLADLDYFRDNFPYASIQDAEVPVSLVAIERITDRPLTRVIILSSNNAQKLKMVTDAFPELKRYKLNAGKEFVQSHLMPDKTWLIVVNRKGSSLEKLMEGLRLDD